MPAGLLSPPVTRGLVLRDETEDLQTCQDEQGQEPHEAAVYCSDDKVSFWSYVRVVDNQAEDGPKENSQADSRGCHIGMIGRVGLTLRVGAELLGGDAHET